MVPAAGSVFVNANAFVVAGIQGPTAQKPTSLLRQVDLAIRHLRQPGLEFLTRLARTVSCR